MSAPQSGLPGAPHVENGVPAICTLCTGSFHAAPSAAETGGTHRHPTLEECIHSLAKELQQMKHELARK